jgi:hypothetical protein
VGTPTPTPGSGGTTPPTTPGENTTTYPSVGAFAITSLSPNTVSVRGSTLVTITGTALPASPSVLIGDSARATIVRATATKLQFRVPARAAGVYDVTVFAPDGTSTVLEDALTYRPDAPSATDPDPGTTPDDGTDPGSGPTPAVPTPTTPGSGSAPVERTGPNGERLVRSATFAALRGIWSVDCSSSCTGVAI